MSSACWWRRCSASPRRRCGRSPPTPPALIEKGWELGLLQASIPEGYGGFGERSAVTGVLAAEELGWGDLSAALAVLAPNAFALPVLTAWTEEQKRQLIPTVIEGGR